LTVHAQTLPAAAGWRWIVDGFAIFRRNPALYSMLVVCYWLTIVFLNLLPFIGQAAAFMVMPGLAVGLMQAARDLERGQPVGLQTLFRSLKSNPRTLVILGILYLCCQLGALVLSSVIDGGDLARVVLDGKEMDREMIEGGALIAPAMFVMALMTPVVMAWWFAPVLAAWHGQGVGKSLFFSLVACWLNWRAFLVYGAGLVLVAGLAPGLLAGLLLLLFPEVQKFITALLTVPMMLVILPVIFASFYVSYRDVFVPAEIA
jgi:hypothetical protein